VGLVQIPLPHPLSGSLWKSAKRHPPVLPRVVTHLAQEEASLQWPSLAYFQSSSLVEQAELVTRRKDSERSPRGTPKALVTRGQLKGSREQLGQK
jgi:hypothetical protein